MPTSVVNSKQITQAVTLLKAGKLVAFPTETVYGLGADANNPAAVKKIFAAKGRPADHPLIVHIANSEQLTLWARDIPAIAWELAKQFWPGPLTLILKKADSVLDLITGKQDTVGLRVPSHPVAQALLQQFKDGIAAPSANKFGHISPTQAAHVQQELGNEVDLILEGGASTIGIESTIIDVSGATPRILRPGAILPSQLNKIMPIKISTEQANNVPRVSGMLLSHYAPITPLKIFNKTELQIKIKELLAADKIFSVITHSLKQIDFNKNLFWYAMPADVKNYAHELYATLRAADEKQADTILLEAVPDTEEWLAIWDRLRKAAAGFC